MLSTPLHTAEIVTPVSGKVALAGLLATVYRPRASLMANHPRTSTQPQHTTRVGVEHANGVGGISPYLNGAHLVTFCRSSEADRTVSLHLSFVESVHHTSHRRVWQKDSYAEVDTQRGNVPERLLTFVAIVRLYLLSTYTHCHTHHLRALGLDAWRHPACAVE